MLKKIIYTGIILYSTSIYSIHITFIGPTAYSHAQNIIALSCDIQNETHHTIDCIFLANQTTPQLNVTQINKLYKNQIPYTIIENTHNRINQVVSCLKSTDLVLYNNVTQIAYIAAQICKIRSIYVSFGLFHIENNETSRGKSLLNQTIKLEKIYNQEFTKYAYPANGSLCFISKTANIFLGYPLFLDAFIKHPQYPIEHTYFFTPQIQQFSNSDFILPQIEGHQKLIYVTFGSKNYKDIFPEIFETIENIIQWLIEDFGNNSEYVFIVGNHKTNITTIPDNFHFYPDFIPQTKVLEHADIFISHGGMNSVNEAIHYNVPLLCIPFLSDQNLISELVQEISIGNAFLQDKPKQGFRKILTKSNFKQTILKTLTNKYIYQENMRKIKEIQPQNFVEIIENIIEKLI